MAYQYARAPGTNTELAKAVTHSCDGKLSDEIIDGTLKDYVPKNKQEQTYVIMHTYMEEEALERIVQAKAGRCDRPA